MTEGLPERLANDKESWQTANGVRHIPVRTAVDIVAQWFKDLAVEQWQRAVTHDWPPSREMAMIRAMWLTDRADELAKGEPDESSGRDLSGKSSDRSSSG